jgi:hypothetical protein
MEQAHLPTAAAPLHLGRFIFYRNSACRHRLRSCIDYKFSVFLETIRIYGPSIQHPSLRPALYTLFQPEANPVDFTSMARRSLISRIYDRTKLDTGDLLVSFLLFLSTFNPEERFRIWSVYWKGTLLIAYWLWSPNDPATSTVIFWPANKHVLRRTGYMHTHPGRKFNF